MNLKVVGNEKKGVWKSGKCFQYVQYVGIALHWHIEDPCVIGTADQIRSVN